MAATTRYGGGCHCGAVRFSVEVSAAAHRAYTCNCSICLRVGFIHVIVERDAFRLEQGSEAITTYRFNTGVARHTFCSVCGVKPFYTPRSHPDGISVNLRCLDGIEDGLSEAFSTEPFDGRNWEASIGALR